MGTSSLLNQSKRSPRRSLLSLANPVLSSCSKLLPGLRRPSTYSIILDAMDMLRAKTHANVTIPTHSNCSTLQRLLCGCRNSPAPAQLTPRVGQRREAVACGLLGPTLAARGLQRIRQARLTQQAARCFVQVPGTWGSSKNFVGGNVGRGLFLSDSEGNVRQRQRPSPGETSSGALPTGRRPA